MASLSEVEKKKLETLFLMSGGYVLDFSNTSFQRFIYNCIKVDIYNGKYEMYGTSKANRLRALWDLESDKLVGRLTEEMLGYCEVQQRGSSSFDKKLYEECVSVAHRLQGRKVDRQEGASTAEDFLKKELDEVSIDTLRIDGAVTFVLQQRIVEVKQCLTAGASLSVIFLCGSILEGLLLGIATQHPKEFNQATSCPKNKDTGKPKQFHEWKLSEFIEVGYELGFLGLDVKKYSHSLRDFRNYIHPYEQLSSGFGPDKYTARISWQVLKAAMHDIHERVK